MNAAQLLDQGTQSWVRLGYETVPNYQQGTNVPDQVDYFWDEGVSGQQVAIHLLGPVPSDADQQWGHYDIHQTAPGVYAISLNQIRTGGGTVAYADTAHLSPLAPNTLVMGEEIAGNGDESAPITWYADLQWYDGAGAVNNQNSLGVVRQDKPPYGGWIAPPSATFSGWFQTYCCEQLKS